MKVSLLKIFDKIIGLYLNQFKSQLPSTPIPENPRKIVVIKLSAMGDVLCLMPAIRELKKWHPQAEITLLTTHRSNSSLFRDIPFIENIVLLPISPPKLLQFINQFRKRKYHLCIDADQYYNISTWLALQCQHSVGFQTPVKPKRLNLSLTYNAQNNEKKEFLKLISLACGKTPPTQFNVRLPELISKEQSALSKIKLSRFTTNEKNKKIVIYPGSSGNADFRRWSVTNYQQLINQLCQQDYELYIAGGPDELEIKEEFSALCNKYPHCHNLIGELELFDWLYFMQHYASLFIGNDAGLLHIAEAAGTPIIGIFGPNIYSKWGSLNKQSIGVEIPIQSLNCRPCIINSIGQIPQQCRRGDNACLSRITPQKIIHEVNQFFSSYKQEEL